MAIKVKIINQLEDNYSYVIFCDKEKKAVILDPAESKPILDFLLSNNLSLKGILITHHHSDHTQGIESIIKNFNVNVYYKGNIVGKCEHIRYEVNKNFYK